MIESDFRMFLENDPSIQSYKAINSRISKGRTVERCCGQSLDMIVANDTLMYACLLLINRNLNNSNGAYSNALRKYYTFANHNTFPQLNAITF
ncbi:hypothetical protein RFF05_09460 [Bengtsoniella intestinalis]|uniref:hypothetical protein n=1 Tax=Bengtsoniella intestinalis TaxID=3073143 RepID=UPI00391EFFA3